jgi:choline dehydrogenase-like flavoprotein
MASKQDLDNWGELGNKGWSFDDMKPYYRKFETYHPASETLGKGVDDKYLDKSLRGTSGPVHVSSLCLLIINTLLTKPDLLPEN